ncbi:MAG: hypothetical protein QXN19_04985 [Sulfolobales archaeon]
MLVCGEDLSGYLKPGCGGFPHGCELNEGGAVGWGYPEWVEANDVGMMKGASRSVRSGVGSKLHQPA